VCAGKAVFFSRIGELSMVTRLAALFTTRIVVDYKPQLVCKFNARIAVAGVGIHACK
jgi:hypothetical protein